MWDPVAGAESYRLERDPGSDGTIVPETVAGKLFYRDLQSEDTDLLYRVCAVYSSGEDCSTWQIAHVGQVQGKLYKDRTWSSDTVNVDGLVQIMDGVTLKIYNGAFVTAAPSPTALPVIMTTVDSHLAIGSTSGGTLPPSLANIQLDFNDAHDLYSGIMGSSGQLVVLDNVKVRLFNPVDVTYTHLKNGSTIAVYPGIGALAASTLTHSVIEGSQSGVQVETGGKAEITQNTFSGCDPCIRLRGAAETTIEHNTFTETSFSDGIDVAGSQATIQNNTFQLSGYGTSGSAGGVRVWPDTGGSVTVKDNVFSGGTSPGSGIVLCDGASPPATGDGPPEVVVMGNTFLSLREGVRICDEINLEAQSNSFSGNTIGVTTSTTGDLGRIRVYANCIAGNSQGLYGPSDGERRRQRELAARLAGGDRDSPVQFTHRHRLLSGVTRSRRARPFQPLLRPSVGDRLLAPVAGIPGGAADYREPRPRRLAAGQHRARQCAGECARADGGVGRGCTVAASCGCDVASLVVRTGRRRGCAVLQRALQRRQWRDVATRGDGSHRDVLHPRPGMGTRRSPGLGAGGGQRRLPHRRGYAGAVHG